MGTKRILLLMTMLALVLAACSGGDDGTEEAAIDDTANAQTTTEAQAADDTADSDEIVEVEPAEVIVEEPEVEAPAPADPVAELPAWMTTELVDARTGETFTLADFAGKTVFVEPMATWCSNCRAQLGRVAQAQVELDAEQHVFIALSLEVGLPNAELADYANRVGFDWPFAVMTPDLLTALSDEFGRGIRSAPNTPHFVIRPDQTFTDLSTGSKRTEQIVQEMLTESGV